MSKKLILLCRLNKLYSIRRIEEEAVKFGITLLICDPDNFILQIIDNKLSISYVDKDGSISVFNRNNILGVLTRFGHIFNHNGIAILKAFEQIGVVCYNNSDSISLCRNKWQCYIELIKYNIPVIDSAFTITPDKLSINYPLIYKPNTGSGGKGISLLKCHKDFFIENCDYKLLQKFISESKGVDWRLFFINGELIASMKRENKNDFRANIHQGAVGKYLIPSKEIIDLAIKANKIIGLNISGVDIIESDEGPLILELNSSPGFEELERVCGLNIANKIISSFI